MSVRSGDELLPTGYLSRDSPVHANDSVSDTTAKLHESVSDTTAKLLLYMACSQCHGGMHISTPLPLHKRSMYY